MNNSKDNLKYYKYKYSNETSVTHLRTINRLYPYFIKYHKCNHSYNKYYQTK